MIRGRHSSGQEIALTPMQQGLLYESASAGRPWVNLEQIVVHLDAEAPDPRALRVAWQQVCARHPVLSLAMLHLTPSPRALAAALTEGAEGGDSPETPEGHTLPDHLVIIQDGTARAPLFGVHVLGRNEEFYRPLAAALGPDQPVYGLSIGLLDSRTPTGVRATAKLYLEEIQTHYPSGVVHLAAVSLGSYFAFELARQLLEAGRELGVLALFDAEGPAGRRRVQGRARLGAHLGLLRRMGLAYLGHVARHRIETLRNSFERGGWSGPAAVAPCRSRR
ncbi:thioesterase domain-containing protein [Phaeobacter inhibens]|uniref:thioesterase domain-containing protein n=1 Tax=Phaeobacter inhibens TaxID=221822 RepID=UPI0021A5159E|nr:thioesterase domain-containing protein [Phaeobacter inhibens]